jgi:hypothetical protein
MDNIKIIRLQSGEDIIATYREEDGEGTVLLANPMTLMFKRLPTGKAIMLMSPWLPIELIESNATWVYTDDILSVMQPKANLIDYYNKSIKELEIEMLASSNDVGQALSSYDDLPEYEGSELDDMEIEEEINEEELMEELNQLRQDVKKRLLH